MKHLILNERTRRNGCPEFILFF